jgi:riboflavin kinase/FMN adenylyltransferase
VHTAAAYLGTRPTFDNGMPVLEVFLFDFDGDLYGHTMEVEFVAHIREDRKFDSAEALVAQMQADCAQARKILAASV